MKFRGQSGICPHCAKFVHFSERGKMNLQTVDTNEIVGQLQASLCPSCQGILIFVTKDEWNSWERFPPPQPISISGTPPRVNEAFREAQLSLAAGAPHAAATMLRRTVASAASDLKVPEKDEKGHFIGLMTRIEGLRDKLLPATYEAAQLTKLLGDGGAHEEAEDLVIEKLGPIDVSSVGRAVEVVGYILSNLYDIPSKVAALRSAVDSE
jgi:hypothetical protein